MKLFKSTPRPVGPFSNRSFLLPRPSFVCFPTAVHHRRSRPVKQPPSSLPATSPLPSLSPSVLSKPAAPCVFSYSPFARGSINLLTCSSNTGKTHFLTQIVQHRHRFFQDADRIDHLIYINANNREHLAHHPWQSSDDNDDDTTSNDRYPSVTGLTITSLTLEHLADLSSVVSPNTILVLDDLLRIDENVQHLLSYGAHHYQLYVLIITQSCISSPLYALLRFSHNLVLLLGNTSSTRLAQHLIQSYFLCSETKAYLKALLGIAEKQRDVVILKINTVASYRPHSHVLALTRVQGLFDQDNAFCYVYPELGHSDQLMPQQNCSNTSFARMDEPVAEMPDLKGQVLPEAFVLLPIGRIQSTSNNKREAGDDDDDDENANDCLTRKKRDWEQMALFLENEIEQSFLPKRWIPAKNLSRQLLLCNDLCIGSDHKTVFVKTKPKRQYSIIDFLNIATRRMSPMEKNSEKVLYYKPLVDVLLKHHSPESFFVNKMLLENPNKRTRRRSEAFHRDFDDEEDTMSPFYNSRHRRRRHRDRQSFSDYEPRRRRSRRPRAFYDDE